MSGVDLLIIAALVQTLNTENNTILTIWIAFYAMIARNAKSSMAISTLDDCYIGCVIGAIHNFLGTQF